MRNAAPRTAGLAAALVLLGAAGCNTSVPFVFPPGFGDGKNAAPRLFYPTGLALAPQAAPGVGGQLLVANGNFDRVFDAGAIYVIDRKAIDCLFAAPGAAPAGCVAPASPDVPFDPAIVLDKALIGNYAGPLVISPTASSAGKFSAFTGSRDTNLLHAVALDAGSGLLSCLKPGGGDKNDCREGFLDMSALAGVDAPYSMAFGSAVLPGTQTDQPALFVGALAPHVTGFLNNNPVSRASFAALDANDPTHLLYSAVEGSSGIISPQGLGANSVLFDAARRQLIVSGCYQRSTGSSAGEPSVFKCASGPGLPTGVAGLLRFISVDAGGDASIRQTDLSPLIGSIPEVSAVALSGQASTPRRLYATLRGPDSIVELELPAQLAGTLTLQTSSPLPLSPGQLLVIGSPPGGAPPPAGTSVPEFIAISSATGGRVDIYESSAGSGTGRVVSSVQGLGDTPFALVQLPPRPGDTQAHLIASIFGSCRLALFDVDYGSGAAVLRARLGSCP